MGVGNKIHTIAKSLGVAAVLSSQGHSDEALLPPGTTLGQFPASSMPTLQNTFATRIVSDITPPPDLVPSNTFRWLLVKIDSGLALTLPENHTGSIKHFGQQEKFFVRFDPNTGLPEISFDCHIWQPYTAGTPVNMSRDEQTTILSISDDLQTLNTLQAEQQALAMTLAEKEDELLQAEDTLNQAQTQYSASVVDLAITDSDRAYKETQKNGLELNIKPEARLRTDVQPTVQSPTLSDEARNANTRSALATYDAATSIQQMPSPVPAPPNNIVIPTPSEVQTTVNLLIQELSRLQTQISDISAQITAKQNEITTTENEITALQDLITGLAEDKIYWQNEYNYWKGEYNRLDGILTTASRDMAAAMSGYMTDKGKLENVGRTDIPSNIDASNMTTLLSNLKITIQAEADAVPSTPKTGTTGTDIGLPDEPSTPRSYLDGNYKYTVDFPSSGVSWPATLRTYIQLPTKSTYSTGATYTVYNRTHSIDTFNKTAKLRIEKLIQKGFVDNVLETDYENYKTQNGIINTNNPKLKTAETNRDDAETELLVTDILLSIKEDVLEMEREDRALLVQQKSDLDALKNLKAQLQTLYNRVKSILDQLKAHIASHGAITQEIANLVALAQSLEIEIANLEIVIAETEGDIAELETEVGSISDDITTIGNSLSQTEQNLLTILQNIPNIIPQDSITRNGTTLVPASKSAAYFTDGYRTGYANKILAGLPAKWIIRYEWMGATNDIYPATASVQYLINGRAYCTEGQKMNNFAHKELVNGYLEETLTKLNTCIVLLNQYPVGSSTGIENFLSALKAQIAGLQASQSTNATIRNHVTATNNFTKETLLQGGSYALFENLMANNAAFSLKIEEITDIMAQKGNIPDGSDAMNDLRHMMTTTFAQMFAERLMTTGTDGLDIYVHWEQEALSFINGLGNTTTLTNQLDMNADWSIDAHGNKYKFGLYHPAGIGNYTVPATLFMVYSPDGTNTQVLGPVQVASGGQADIMKARWQQELLKMKRMHADYAGGTYDIFRGTDEAGRDVWWGKYVTRSGGWIEGTNFSDSYGQSLQETTGKIDLYNQFFVTQPERARKELFLSRFLFLMLRREQDMILDTTYKNLLQTRINQLGLNGYSSNTFRIGDQDMGVTEGEGLILGEIYGGVSRAKSGLSNIEPFLHLYPDNGTIIKAIVFEEQSHLIPFEDTVIYYLRKNGSYGLGQIQNEPSQRDKDFFGFEEASVNDLLDTEKHVQIMNERINKIRVKLREYNLSETPENIGKAWNGGPGTITGIGSQHAQDYGKRINLYSGNTEQIIHDIETNSISETLAGYIIYLDEIHLLINNN